MSTTRSYTKNIVNKNKFSLEVKELPTIKNQFLKWGIFGSELTIYLDSNFTTAQEVEVDAYVNGFVDFTTAETLEIYLDNQVYPFIKSVINTFAAENIAMGITQAGKTGDLLGLFVKGYDVHSNSLPISLRDTFDSGSLYESCTVIQHLRDNSTEFDGLSPFITDARLLEMKNKIETFLGLELST